MADHVQFGPFTFGIESGALSKLGSVVRLQPQPARVLAALVRRAGDVVSRDELRREVWPTGTYVDFERGLNFAVAQIRSALGDSADRPVYVETLPKRGYRFIAPVTRSADAAPPAKMPPDAAPPAKMPPDAVPPAKLPDAAPPAKMLPDAAPPAQVLPVVEPIAVPNRKRLSAWAGVVIGVGALAAFALTWTAYQDRPIRVAVVSFDNETGQDAFDEVAVAIADQTVARLATPDRLARLSVVGNSAALRRPRDFRDIKEIGRAVDVRYVVLAQMKIDSSKARLIAHLIRVSDEAHVWANSYDREAFTLDAQNEIAEAIAAAVSTQLAGS
jgi:DNA-binding winged helix-turn-helix (wHTH) protein/TolB-like protein